MRRRWRSTRCASFAATRTFVLAARTGPAAEGRRGEARRLRDPRRSDWDVRGPSDGEGLRRRVTDPFKLVEGPNAKVEPKVSQTPESQGRDGKALEQDEEIPLGRDELELLWRDPRIKWNRTAREV